LSIKVSELETVGQMENRPAPRCKNQHSVEQPT